MGKRRWIMGDKLMHNFSHFEDNKLTLIPPFAHKEPKDDDLGLPEHPIFSNYSKYLWTSHKRTGGVEVQEPSSKQAQKLQERVDEIRRKQTV